MELEVVFSRGVLSAILLSIRRYGFNVDRLKTNQKPWIALDRAIVTLYAARNSADFSLDLNETSACID